MNDVNSPDVGPQVGPQNASAPSSSERSHGRSNGSNGRSHGRLDGRNGNAPAARGADVTDSGQRDRRSVDERREQLVDATIEVLAEEGLSRATTRRITDQAGLALGAFHYAFRSKDELLEAVIERVASGVEDVLNDASNEPVHDTAEAVTRIVTVFWEFIEESPDLQLAQYELTLHALREPALRRLAIRQYERYSEAVGNAIDRVPDPPTGQDRDDLARFVVATIDGLVLHSFVDSGHPDAAKRRLELYLSSLDNFVPESERVAS